MTEFELKHGLSQDEPGPLEPVEIAAPGVSTVEDAPAALNRDRIEEIAREVYKVERFTKDDEVWHNLHWLTTFAKAIEKELRPAPAAGDALDAARYRWLRVEANKVEQFGSFSPYVIQGQTANLLSGASLDACVDAAIAAQRKGDV